LGIVLQLSVIEAQAAAIESPFAAAAKKQYRQTQAVYVAQSSRAENAWQFARACFDVADYSTNSAERALLAEQGIAACRQLLAREPNSVAGHYYLGMNLGQLAQTKGLAALKIVDQMEQEFAAARELDEHFDFAGPDRNLGLLYRDAPSIGSIGSRSKAHKHLQKAVDLAPDYPENRLNLIEAFIGWSDRNGARRELKALEGIWSAARTNLAGEAWAPSWADWKQRFMKARKKVEEPAKTLESPRAKD
jgi:tetratricopeptide (TPR) repeat protein